MRHTLVSNRILLLALFTVLLTSASWAQQMAYVVPAPDGTVSVFDLATNNLLKRFPLAEASAVSMGIGPNPRLGVSVYNYPSIVDFSVGHEILRMPNVDALPSSPPVFTSDGRLLLITDVNEGGMLEVFNAGTFELNRRPRRMGLRLAPAMGSAAQSIETIVAAGSKVFMVPFIFDSNRPALGLVDLRSYRVSAVPVPYGAFDDPGWTPNAGITPDGNYVIVTYYGYDSGAINLLYISTSSNSVVAQYQPPIFDCVGLVISPASAMPYGYLVQQDDFGDASVVALDLASGQLLPNTSVPLDYSFAFPTGFAISPDGASLAVSTYDNGGSNVVIISTSKMFSDPAHAIVGGATVPGGTYGVTIAPVVTTPLGTAPTVTGVSGSVTNDQDTTIHVTGTNFAAGARVRIGALPLQATVNSSTDLEVTVPRNAPAGPNQDVVVTNPQLASPPASRFQSGLLAGGMNIHLNSNFQPQHDFASLNFSTGSLSYYDFGQRAMVGVPLTAQGYGNLTFNAQGADLYTESLLGSPAAVTYDLPTHNQRSIALTGDLAGRYMTAVGSVNPLTGKSVVYEWTYSFSTRDVYVNMLDSDPESPTFNMVIKTLSGGVRSNGTVWAGAATPDGKYVYVSYRDSSLHQNAIAIFDVVNGGPATVVTTASLNIANAQFCMQVSPDGTTLVANSPSTPDGQPIALVDITNPLNPQLLTSISGSLPAMALESFQVVGNRLFAMDFNNRLLVAFNFDRQHSNFSQLGADHWVGNPVGSYSIPYLAVSPDGNLLYLGVEGDDMISVYDANLLAASQPALITNLAAPLGPRAMAVSPVAHGQLVSKNPLTNRRGATHPLRPTEH